MMEEHGGYVLADTSDVPEGERLRRLAAARDPLSFESLERVGVAAGWSCLEVGVGTGS